MNIVVCDRRQRNIPAWLLIHMTEFYSHRIVRNRVFLNFRDVGAEPRTDKDVNFDANVVVGDKVRARLVDGEIQCLVQRLSL